MIPHRKLHSCFFRSQRFRGASLLLLSLLAIFFLVSSAHGQGDREERKDRYGAEVGLLVGYGFHFLSGDLSPGLLSGNVNLTSACGTFQSGSGNGITLAGTFGYRLRPHFRGEFGLGYANYSGAMEFRCVDPAEIRMPDGSLREALTNHRLRLDRTQLQGELSLWFRPSRLPIEFGAGGYVGMNLIGEYSLHEEIVTPTNAEFTTGGQQREYGSGAMNRSGGNISAGLEFGIAGELPAGSALLLRPQVRYYLPLTDPFGSEFFRQGSLRVGIQIVKQFDLFPPKTSTPLEPIGR